MFNASLSGKPLFSVDNRDDWDIDMEIFLAFWLTMGVGAGLIARFKGYSFLGWFIYGFFLGGIALLHSIVLRAKFRSEHGF